MVPVSMVGVVQSSSLFDVWGYFCTSVYVTKDIFQFLLKSKHVTVRILWGICFLEISPVGGNMFIQRT